MTADREPQDVEARLRASLHAYADAVDDRPAGRSPVGGGRNRPPSSRVRGWRSPVLVAAAVLAVAGGTWLVTVDPGVPSPTAAEGSGATVLEDSRAESGSGADAATQPQSPGEDAAAAAEVGPGGQLVVPPPAEVGVSYPFDLYTHCGIFGADVGGLWFAADPPLIQAPNGPPTGWGDPYQRGTLILESADEAVFRDDLGHELTLRAAPESERPPPCD